MAAVHRQLNFFELQNFGIPVELKLKFADYGFPFQERTFFRIKSHLLNLCNPGLRQFSGLDCLRLPEYDIPVVVYRKQKICFCPFCLRPGSRCGFPGWDTPDFLEHLF